MILRSEGVGVLPVGERRRAPDLVQVGEGAVAEAVDVDVGLVVPPAPQSDFGAVPTLVGGNHLEPVLDVAPQDVGVEAGEGRLGTEVDEGVFGGGERLPAAAGADGQGILLECQEGDRPGLVGQYHRFEQVQARNVPGRACSARRREAPPHEWPKPTAPSSPSRSTTVARRWRSQTRVVTVGGRVDRPWPRRSRAWHRKRSDRARARGRRTPAQKPVAWTRRRSSPSPPKS